MSAESVAQQQMHTLYSDHHGWLYGWLRRKLGCSHNAADVAHDTFVRILASRDMLAGQGLSLGEPRAYLTTTAQRLIIDRARRHAIEQAYLAEIAGLANQGAAYPSPEEIVAAVQALDEISAVLDRVAAKPREAFLLHYLDGQTHAATAAQLGVSVRMVQKYLAGVLVQCSLLMSAAA